MTVKQNNKDGAPEGTDHSQIAKSNSDNQEFFVVKRWSEKSQQNKISKSDAQVVTEGRHSSSNPDYHTTSQHMERTHSK